MSYDRLTQESPVDTNITRLAQAFPSVVREGKVDFDALRQLLGDDIGEQKELFGLNWKGKAQARRAALTPSLGTLRPCPEESVDWDSTKNLYIEGDNLEVLKLLRKSYSGKVKMIYIDPPYNTGKEFVYPDDYRHSVESYKELIGPDGDYSPNSKDNGRFHTKWLNMMYPRLAIARDLLSDDGCIFVSVDFNEFDNLKKIMDDLFGELNFQREIIWRIGWLSGYKTTAENFIRNHDTILFYSKNYNRFSFKKQFIKNSDFKPLVKKTPEVTSYMKSLGLDDQKITALLHFLNHENRPDKYPMEDTWNCNEYDDLNSISITSFSGEKISKILGIEQDFKGQKSVKMLGRLLDVSANSGDIIMDFFSGTSSTAHAVMQMNAEDGGKRRHIMVQLPEPCDKKSEAYKAGYKNICEIGKERIRRAGKKLKEEAGLIGQGLDTGFRVYKLDSSNVKPCDPDAEDLGASLDLFSESLVEGRTPDDLLTEVMLKSGIDLCEETETREIAGHRVYSLGYGQFYACMDLDLSGAEGKLALGIAAWHADECAAVGGGQQGTCTVFVVEQAFAGCDAAKMNFVNTLQQYGICKVEAL